MAKQVTFRIAGRSFVTADGERIYTNNRNELIVDDAEVIAELRAAVKAKTGIRELSYSPEPKGKSEQDNAGENDDKAEAAKDEAAKKAVNGNTAAALANAVKSNKSK